MKVQSIILLSMFILSSCAQKQTIEEKKDEITYSLNKAFIRYSNSDSGKLNFSDILFYECEINNNSDNEIELTFSYDMADYITQGQAFCILSEKDSLELFSRYRGDKNTKIPSRKMKIIELCLENGVELFKKSGMENYSTFLDSVSFVTQKIVVYQNNKKPIIFNPKEDYVMEHRFITVFTEGEGSKN